MSKRTEYKTIQSYDLDDFNEQINELSKQGWNPFMSLNINDSGIILPGGDGWTFTQQLTRCVDEKDKPNCEVLESLKEAVEFVKRCADWRGPDPEIEKWAEVINNHDKNI